MMYTVGHKIPDSDSTCSALSLAYLMNKLGREATPAVQGKLNPETKFILKTFGFEAPQLKQNFDGDNVFITDHSDRAQSHDLTKATIVGIVDHHKLGDMTSKAPLECWIRPVGCTNTIVKEMYDFHKVAIPKGIAGLMMSAILSDTVIFKSPTCTPVDIAAVEELALIAEVDDYRAFALEMFKVKSKIEGTPTKDLVLRDFKDFEMNGKKIGVGQLEVVDISLFDDIKDDLMNDLKTFKNDGRNSMLLLLTDIIKEGSELLVVSDDEAKIEDAFDVKLTNNKAWLEGVLSRKKQVIPNLETAFAN
ncbi:MAG: Manganese-dependent inorganic pyrophosphatase (EC [uncultured Campylobacterales bacterium]|uniref:inorganic diphosphatase n=1 Tax=uncultured Campylobacterales bacterium TaxID=352960 RepID=A0A6S6SAX1_9BACT|nr:MAG: Manganese-dependent inorganic pyrophosphatase (EC [uncultured Campylobacterales bacterium]